MKKTFAALEAWLNRSVKCWDDQRRMPDFVNDLKLDLLARDRGVHTECEKRNLLKATA